MGFAVLEAEDLAVTTDVQHTLIESNEYVSYHVPALNVSCVLLFNIFDVSIGRVGSFTRGDSRHQFSIDFLPPRATPTPPIDLVFIWGLNFRIKGNRESVPFQGRSADRRRRRRTFSCWRCCRRCRYSGCFRLSSRFQGRFSHRFSFAGCAIGLLCDRRWCTVHLDPPFPSGKLWRGLWCVAALADWLLLSHKWVQSDSVSAVFALSGSH